MGRAFEVTGHTGPAQTQTNRKQGRQSSHPETGDKFARACGSLLHLVTDNA